MIDVVEDGKYVNSTDVDAKTRSQRVATAADWLAKTVDGVLADGKKRLLIEYDVIGQKGIVYITKRLLQSFYCLGNLSSDQEIKSLLLSKLQRLKETVVKEMGPVEKGKKLSFEQEDATETLADLNYVIAVYQGNTPAELPPESDLRISQELLVAANVKTEAASKTEPAPKNELVPKSEPITKNKPVYEGNTFDQWIDILRANRDYKAQSMALEACLAIMKTEQEQKQILEGARAFMKTLDRKFRYSAFSNYSLYQYERKSLTKDKRPASVEAKEAAIVQYHDLLLRVLNSCDQSIVFDFFKAEMKDETQLCHQVLWNWIRDSNSNVIVQRSAELIDVFTENFDKPLVRAIAIHVVSVANEDRKEELTRLQGADFGIKIKDFVRTATPAKRLEVLQLAFGIFPDDLQVLQAYEEDLLDPKLNELFVRVGGGRWRKERHSKGVLFLFAKNQIASTSYYEAPDLSATRRQQRLATAADWLAKVVDGYFAAGDQRLEFSIVWVSVNNGPREFVPLKPSEMARILLRKFYDMGSGTSDLRIKQLLLPKLQQFKKSIIEDEREEELSESQAKNRKQTLADLDYVIAFFEGSPPAELPPNSRLRIRKVKESE